MECSHQSRGCQPVIFMNFLFSGFKPCQSKKKMGNRKTSSRDAKKGNEITLYLSACSEPSSRTSTGQDSLTQKCWTLPGSSHRLCNGTWNAFPYQRPFLWPWKKWIAISAHYESLILRDFFKE